MARGAGPPLPKGLQVVQAQIVSRKVEEGVEKHGAVAQGEDEPVPIGPGGIQRVVPKVLGPDLIPGRSQPHGGARVARVRSLDRVHGENTDGVDEVLIPGGAFKGRHGSGLQVREKAAQISRIRGGLQSWFVAQRK